MRRTNLENAGVAREWRELTRMTENPSSNPGPIMDHAKRQVECAIPVLPVRELKRSISFYTEILGYKLDWSGDAVCSVSRDGCPIMLSAAVKPAGSAWVWIGLEDDSIFAEYRKRGVKVRQEPRNRPWAYEMKFEDLDGNVLWLGTETRKDLPLDEAAD